MSQTAANHAARRLDDILSIQLYSLRALGPVERQLDAAAGAGFRLVETIGSHLADAKGVKAGLDARGLTAPTGHIGIGDLRGDLPRIADAAHTVGITQLYMPAYPAEERGRTGESWKKAGAELGALAERLKAEGIGLGYHNHHWELEILDDGRTALESFFAGAEGSPVTWQADIAWLARGGVDPAEWLARYSAILTSAHVKDQAPAGVTADDGWTDVGAGILDWNALWTAARANGAGIMTVEHDNPSDPAGFAARSHDWLAKAIK